MATYKYDSAGLNATIQELKTDIEDYVTKVATISNLIQEMYNSASWKQEKVKPAFITKCNEYIGAFEVIIAKLEAHLKYIETKNISMENFESAYTRRS